MIRYITSLICKDFLFGPKTNVDFKVLSGPFTIVFLFFCQRLGVVTATVSCCYWPDQQACPVCFTFILEFMVAPTVRQILQTSTRRSCEVMCCFLSLGIDRSSCNVARFPIASLTFW